MNPRKFVRAVGRSLGLFALLLSGGFEFWWLSRLRSHLDIDDWRGVWLQNLVRRLVKWMGVRIQSDGVAPHQGLLVANHISYLDILVLASAQPLLFLSKSEVRHWPLIGWLTQCAGSLYVNRERPLHSSGLVDEIADQCLRGRVVAFFPEGTTTNGNSVLRFRSSLFQPAVDHALPVTPASIRYNLLDGDAGNVVGYWGSMTFFPHLFRLLGEREIGAEVRYGKMLDPSNCRKSMAKEAWVSVQDLLGLPTPDLLERCRGGVAKVSAPIQAGV